MKKKGTRYFQKSVFVNNKVNEQIQAAQVRVIGSDGMQLGILPIHEAQAKAREYDLDLVEVAPNADPPVCKLMDYGKFRYQQQKRAQEVKKKQTVIQVKELKIRPKINPHDYQFKLQHVKRFLQRGDKAKISVLFRGREIVHRDLGQKILERFIEDVKEVGEVESMPKMDGHNMTMVLIARSHKKEEKGSNTFQE